MVSVFLASVSVFLIIRGGHGVIVGYVEAKPGFNTWGIGNAICPLGNVRIQNVLWFILEEF